MAGSYEETHFNSALLGLCDIYNGYLEEKFRCGLRKRMVKEEKEQINPEEAEFIRKTK